MTADSGLDTGQPRTFAGITAKLMGIKGPGPTGHTEQAMTESKGRGNLIVDTEPLDGIIRISFADDGPGIPPEIMNRIFDPFFTTKEVGKGTGLGLSICYGIITSQGGRIYTESKPGSGATFIIELPICTH